MKTILIAEDNDINYELFRRILNKFDVNLVHAVNGKEAVEICETNSDICLVLMDINMPVMDGEEATVLIKTANPNITIISQTAYIAYGSVKEENKKYFSEFITKPIDVVNLKRIVMKYCFDEN